MSLLEEMMGRPKINRIGNIYGELTVISEAPSKNNRIIWKCKCSCGKIKTIFGTNLNSGSTISCGCVNIKNHTVHGMRKHPLYNVWRHMIQRCYNPETEYYKNYGKRGISVCEEWKDSPVEFIKWAENNGYKKDLQIDRENNDGNYKPSNCRFVTSSINNCNRRKQKNNISGYIGVRKQRNTFYWTLQFGKLKKRSSGYKTIKQAAIARNKYIEKNNLPNQKNKI